MRRVNEELLQWAAESGDTSGCTAVIAMTIDNSYFVAHIGDSRAVLCQQNAASGVLMF